MSLITNISYTFNVDIYGFAFKITLNLYINSFAEDTVFTTKLSELEPLVILIVENTDVNYDLNHFSYDHN